MRHKDLNVEWCTMVAAAIQNSVQCHCVIYDEKRRATTQTLLGHFFKEGERVSPAEIWGKSFYNIENIKYKGLKA